jgi:site-specific DNA-cytosine methylase
MNILLACEESQAVCKAYRERGHNAFSCDIIECSGGHPEWHIKQDVLPLLNGNCEFYTTDGKIHKINGKWDMIIAFPPCTFLTVTGNRWFNIERYGEKALERIKEREKAIEFFMAIVNADCNKIAIENPIGIMSSKYRKADQVIQPYEFGHPARKSTCLWLKNLPKLEPTCVVEPEIYHYVAKNGRTKSDSRWRSQCKKEDRSKHRSKTFEGIAKAMAEQWG